MFIYILESESDWSLFVLLVIEVNIVNGLVDTAIKNLWNICFIDCRISISLLTCSQAIDVSNSWLPDLIWFFLHWYVLVSSSSSFACIAVLWQEAPYRFCSSSNGTSWLKHLIISRSALIQTLLYLVKGFLMLNLNSRRFFWIKRSKPLTQEVYQFWW